MAEKTYVEKARGAAGISQVAAGSIMGMSNITFGRKEKDPEQFTLGEFFKLYREMDSDSQALMWAELESMAGKNFDHAFEV